MPKNTMKPVALVNQFSPLFLRSMLFALAVISNFGFTLNFKQLRSLGFGAFSDTRNHRFANGSVAGVAVAHVIEKADRC